MCLAPIKVHVEKVMAIVLLCESAQQFRALMMILQMIILSQVTEHDFYDAIPMLYLMCFCNRCARAGKNILATVRIPSVNS